MKNTQKIGIIQAVLQTLSTKSQNKKIGIKIYSCCVFSQRSVWCAQIMRWWCSNLGQAPLRTQAPFTNYTSYSNPPDPPVSTDLLDLFISPLYPTAP